MFSNTLQALWIFDAFSDLFPSPDPPENHPLRVQGPDLQNEALAMSHVSKPISFSICSYSM